MFQFRENCNMQGVGGGTTSGSFLPQVRSSEIISETIFGPK